MTPLQRTLAALPNRRAWIVGLSSQRDAEVARACPEAADLWALLVAELAALEDDDRNTLARLDFAPGLDNHEAGWGD